MVLSRDVVLLADASTPGALADLRAAAAATLTKLDIPAYSTAVLRRTAGTWHAVPEAAP